ncbi:hypothetical protein [Xenorhabdus szentirmaii]|uniref:Diaminopimelate decarboxylase n=1 Tax=Xenorhabdus szentirmaii DSM 16338 TaxID=1427518 RepID=W1J4V1_9GAMM|nr:hypothetical protein [Xenorhabdus szentirmaii]PHM34659.1 diaminopimelate decarboxylase [Xenorhabdus szentirmaii DSM 16338]PHM43391.1 diaminopimelate decarboxylase [Xenorhabdus szentirmaii]CDL85088.1 Diaminopimelate decarboxylase [Xenorhabdus szentirmaii DSM 16338]
MNNIETLKFLEPDEIPHLVEKYGTPLFVYDLPTIKKHYDYFCQIPNPYGLTVRYSVKANPTRAILAQFNKLGASFDVSSVWEARRCINAGIDANKILITAQEISEGWETLCKAGMEFDAGSLQQLKTYGEKFPNTQVSIRINPGFGSGLVKKLTSGGNHSSFGLWFEQFDEAITLAKHYSLTIKRVHLHIGSGHDSAVLEKTVNRALELCAKVPSVTHLNLGGGYKITALNSDPHYDHHAMGSRVSASLEQFQRETGRKLHLEVEPGTFSMALSGSLITRVIDVVNTGDNGYRFIKIDGGLTEIMRPSYYGALHPLVVVKHDGTLETNDIDEQMVCGHCCIAGDSLTPVAGNTEDFTPVLLARAEINDYLVVERTGGYAASMSVKNFNSYPEAAEVCRVSKGAYHIIRERQTLEQMTQNERDLPLI